MNDNDNYTAVDENRLEVMEARRILNGQMPYTTGEWKLSEHKQNLKDRLFNWLKQIHCFHPVDDWVNLSKTKRPDIFESEWLVHEENKILCLKCGKVINDNGLVSKRTFQEELTAIREISKFAKGQALKAIVLEEFMREKKNEQGKL